jgi:hypothetical protein
MLDKEIEEGSEPWLHIASGQINRMESGVLLKGELF